MVYTEGSELLTYVEYKEIVRNNTRDFRMSTKGKTLSLRGNENH